MNTKSKKVPCPICERKISRAQLGRHMQIHSEQTSAVKAEPDSDHLFRALPKLDEDRMRYLRAHRSEPRTRLARKLGIRKVHLIQIMINEGILRGGEGA